MLFRSAASVNTNINLVAAGGQTTLTANLIDGLPQEIALALGGNNSPIFTSNPVIEANAVQGSPYSSTLADNAADADGDPLTFSKISGPAWLTVSTNGSLSGIPGGGDLGTNNWTVQVSDGASSTNATLQIIVSAATGGTKDRKSTRLNSSH